jgi:hypothetical protein
MIQEKQSIDQGTKYTSNGFQRYILPHSPLSIFFHAMHRVPMETALVLLEKPII